MAHPKAEPFHIAVPDEVLTDLRTRLERTRFADDIPDTGWEYGTNLAYLRELVDYWMTRYDWRSHERAINRFAHYRASVDGLLSELDGDKSVTPATSTYFRLTAGNAATTFGYYDYQWQRQPARQFDMGQSHGRQHLQRSDPISAYPL